MVAQCCAFVGGAEKPAALQDRNHLIDEDVQLAWEVGGHDVEAIRGACFEPRHDMIYDLRRCPADGAVRWRRCHQPAAVADRKVLGIGFVEKTYHARSKVAARRTDVCGGEFGVSRSTVKRE